MQDLWSKVDAEVKQQEDKLFKTATFPLTEGQYLPVPGLCHATEAVAADSPYQVAEAVGPSAAPSDGAVPFRPEPRQTVRFRAAGTSVRRAEQDIA